MDNFTTGTKIAAGIGAGIGAAAVFKGMMSWETYLTGLFIVAIIAAVYIVWITVSTWWCDLPVIGALFCRRRFRGREQRLKGRPSGAIRRAGGAH